MQFWQSVFWFSACVACAALTTAFAAYNSDLSLGEADSGGVLCGLGVALAVLVFKAFVEWFIHNVVQIVWCTVVFCCIGIVGVVSEEGPNCPRYCRDLRRG